MRSKMKFINTNNGNLTVINRLSISLIIFVIFLLCVIFSLNYRRVWMPRSPDMIRVNDVLSLSWRIVLYDHINGGLPDNLSQLDVDGKWVIPTDPVTFEPYHYEIIGRKAFRLCATFSAASSEHAGAVGTVLYGDPVTHGYGSWVHGSGKQCTDRHLPNE